MSFEFYDEDTDYPELRKLAIKSRTRDTNLFRGNIKKLIPHISTQSVDSWIQFADDCIRNDQYMYDCPKNNTPYQHFFSELLRAYSDTIKEFGLEISDLITLGSEQFSLYPYEFKGAAQFLAKGGNPKEFGEMSKKGLFESS